MEEGEADASPLEKLRAAIPKLLCGGKEVKVGARE
jgi:hypothetical protein